MKKTIFTGAGVAIVTPMNPDESINFEELGRLIDHQIENGTDAIVICGTTGESSTMTDQEHVDCIAYAVERTAGRVPVIAGAGSNHTSYVEDGYCKLFIPCGGADDPRPIKLRRKGNGQWFLWEQYLMTGIRIPTSADPWA